MTAKNKTNPNKNNIVYADVQIGHFLSEDLWQEAIRLLDCQLELKKHYKHFNTLSMLYYAKIPANEKARLTKPEYFIQKIANNLFYGLEREFAIHSYFIPKSNLGIRKICLFSYPMRILYYSIGLYLLQLSQEFIEQYYSLYKETIHSHYGGNLHFDQEHKKLKISPKKHELLYMDDYKKFRREVKKEIRQHKQDTIVLFLDIQNYFEEISIPVLLNFLTQYTKPTIQREFKFDLSTKEQIVAFFQFIASPCSGIPQSENDIISNLIGHLYLMFGDLLIEEEIRKIKELQRFSIIRYMDDIYVVLVFKQGISDHDKGILISNFSYKISDCLYQKLGLRLNTKTKIFWLGEQKDEDNLRKKLKRVSPEYEFTAEDASQLPRHKWLGLVGLNQ